MDDIITDRRVSTNVAITELTHKIATLIILQEGSNKELLQGITDLKDITAKHSKTLYGNGTAGICEDTRRIDSKLVEVSGEIEKARARRWGLIFAVIAFVVVEIIKII